MSESIRRSSRPQAVILTAAIAALSLCATAQTPPTVQVPAGGAQGQDPAAKPRMEVQGNKIVFSMSETSGMELKEFVKDMTVFMLKGLKWGTPMGLAAPQVGRPIRCFVALGEVFINPEILWMPKANWQEMKEGCYSLEEGNFDYPVRRAYAVKLKWTDLNGNEQVKRFNGFHAEVIQHEMDHLEGKLINGKGGPHDHTEAMKEGIPHSQTI